MEQDRFYVMREAGVGSPEDKVGGTRAMRAEASNQGDAPKCPACGQAIGLLTWLPPYQVDIELWGKQFGDILIEGSEDLLVSDRFKLLYQSHQLAGLDGFEPVEIVSIKPRRKSHAELPRYFKACRIRTRAAVDQAASGFRWNNKAPICPECLRKKNCLSLKAYKSITIKPGTWKGEDIFHARGSPENFLVSQRFKDVCVENELRNVVFLPAESFSWREEDDCARRRRFR